MAARGIKSKIGFNVAILLLLSAILTDILVVVVVQSVMIRDTISQSRKYTQNIGHLFFSDFAAPQQGFNPKQELATTLILSQERIQTIYIVDSRRNLLYQQNGQSYPIDMVKDHINSAFGNKKTVTEALGYSWAIFWWHPKAISISCPILDDDKPRGVITAIIPLTPIYMQLRKYHNPIIIYILINTAILTIVGLYRIFKLYLRPIHRIVQQADGFQEKSDIFFAFRQEDNELNRLSSALNRMLTRISTDKKKLQATVASLEKANIELKNTQKEMIRAEKMASVGRLAAGIAHEIGNPIGIVLGYLDMLKREGLGEEDKGDFLQRTEDEVQRISTVIRQLLDMTRPKEPKNEHVMVNSVLRDIIEVMQFQPVMNDIRIETDLDASQDLIWGNDDQLRQVFLNLMLNAADAIRGSASSAEGRIMIRTINPDVSLNSAKPMIRVLLQDNGDGIDREKLQNIFDPFYTTKEPGKGTGLGLAVSYMIIDGIGGIIHADSRPGDGATFSIELPIAANDPNTKNDAIT